MPPFPLPAPSRRDTHAEDDLARVWPAAHFGLPAGGRPGRMHRHQVAAGSGRQDLALLALELLGRNDSPVA
jgi:hypothetical protein